MMQGVGGRTSIVIPCFNQAKFLPFSIRSALMQTLPAHEVIVINDGSSDHTEQIVSSYPSVRYAYQQNKGVAAARNLGASIAEGEYLLFLDADDQLLPNALESGSTILATRPEFGLVYGRSRVIDSWGNLIFEQSQGAAQCNTYSDFLRECHIWTPSMAVHRRANFLSVGGYNESLKHSEEYELYLRLSYRSSVYYHDVVVTEYRTHPEAKSMSSAKMLRAGNKIFDLQREFVRGSKELEEAWRAGRTFWHTYYGAKLADDLLTRAYCRVRKLHVASDIAILLRFAPGSVIRAVEKRFSDGKPA
jgi:glycosyltransferase involved in cell wall biosynthesis